MSIKTTTKFSFAGDFFLHLLWKHLWSEIFFFCGPYFWPLFLKVVNYHFDTLPKLPKFGYNFFSFSCFLFPIYLFRDSSADYSFDHLFGIFSVMLARSNVKEGGQNRQHLLFVLQEEIFVENRLHVKKTSRPSFSIFIIT